LGKYRRDFQITNDGEYLERHPALDEVEIKPGEGTAWSCVHGVGRWYRDCGCQNSGPDRWQQAWRGPLRRAFDLLRDHAARSFEEMGGALFRDPWKARDKYINVV
jgi:alpha-amylase/alpha-mannosidase (GH57 family)